MTRLVAIVLAAIAVTLAPLWVSGAERKSAPEIYAAARAGEVVLIDIRQPQEWAESGVPRGAVPLTLQDPSFGDKLGAILERANGRPLAVICRTGGRSAYLTARLGELGLANVIDVSEGVYGSAAGPGWLAHGLPVERPYEGAFAERLEALAAE